MNRGSDQAVLPELVLRFASMRPRFMNRGSAVETLELVAAEAPLQ